MKRLLISAAVALAAMGAATMDPAAMGRALAADLPEPAPPPPRAPATYIPVVAPVYNWGGIYYGVNGGYGFGTSEWTTPFATTGSFNTSGYAVGATVGANVQADAFVFGVEADFDAMGLKGSTNVCLPVTCQTQDNWLGTVRARVGYAADRVLFYGTAGGAYGNIQANTSGTSFQSTSEPGWAAGAGIEAAFADNWTARIEYLFVDLENASFSTLAGTETVKLDANLIRVGVDYKFR